MAPKTRSQYLVKLCITALFAVTLTVASSSPPPLSFDADELKLRYEGAYMATYAGCGASCANEMINIYYDDGRLIGIKVEGDDYVPGGEVSFIVDMATRTAHVHRAQKNFARPRLDPTPYPVSDLSAGRITIELPRTPVCGPIDAHRISQRHANNKSLVDMLLHSSLTNKWGRM